MNARAELKLLTHLAWTILCAAACLGCAQPAAAEDAEPGDVPTVTVYYGDLNLQRPESVASLYRRIQRAAERVCVRSNSRVVQQIHAARRCAEQAVDRAVVSIDMPALARYAVQAKARAPGSIG